MQHNPGWLLLAVTLAGCAAMQRPTLADWDQCIRAVQAKPVWRDICNGPNPIHL